MAPVTVDAGARNSYYSAGNIGWSARSLFQNRIAIANLTSSGSSRGLGSANNRSQVAQSFTTGSAIDINEIRIQVAKVGAPTDNISCEIQANSGGVPSGTALATATNVYSGSNMAISPWPFLSFMFLTPVSLSASTKYWIVCKRSGAVDAANYYSFSMNAGSNYANGETAYYDSSVPGWTADGNDFVFQVLTATPSALYAVTQDTSLHVWKSTDNGASWAEQDSANKPTVNSATSPFSACDSISGPVIGVVYFSAANTNAVRYFRMDTDTWTTSNWGTTPPAATSVNRPIRVSNDNTGGGGSTYEPGQFYLAYTSNADDADLLMARAATSAGAWTVDTSVLALTSTEKSTFADQVADKSATKSRIHRFYYDVLNDDFSYRAVRDGTQGTEGDVDATAADIDTEHASLVAEIYQSSSGVDTAIIAFIDADGTLEERIATLEADPPTFATQNQVSSDTGGSGRQISTCRYNGVNYIAVCDGSNIDYHSSSTAGTWSNNLNWKTGLTSGTISQILPVYGLGVLIAYTDNGDTKVDWIKRDVLGIVSGDTIAVSGLSGSSIDTVYPAAHLSTSIFGNNTNIRQMQQVVPTVTGFASTFSAKLAVTGTVTDDVIVGIYALDGSLNPTGSALATTSKSVPSMGLTGTPAYITFPEFSPAVMLTAGTMYGIVMERSGAQDAANYLLIATNSSNTYPAGQSKIYTTSWQVGSNTDRDIRVGLASILARVNFTGTITADSIPATGQTVGGSPGGAVSATGTITADSIAASSQSITGKSGALGSITQDSIAASGPSITGKSGSKGTVTQDSIPASGPTISATFGQKGTITADSIPATGPSIAGRSGAKGTISQDSIPASGPSIVGKSGSKGTITQDSIPATAASTAARSGTASSVSFDSIPATGQAVTGTPVSKGVVTQDGVPATGQSISATSGSKGSITSDVIPAGGQSVVGKGGIAATVTPDTVPAVGQTITGVGGSKGTVTADSIPATGQSVLGKYGTFSTITADQIATSGQTTAGRSGALGVVSQDVVPATGQTVVSAGSAAATGVVTVGSIPTTGQTVIAKSGLVVSVSVDSIPTTAQTVTSLSGANGQVSVDSVATTGQTTTGTSATLATVGLDVVAAVGNSVLAPLSTIVGSVAVDAVPATGQVVDGVGGSGGLITADQISVVGLSTTANAGVFALLNPDQIAVTPSTVAGLIGMVGQVSPDNVPASGQLVVVFITAADERIVFVDVIPASGQVVTGRFGTQAVVDPDVVDVVGQIVFSAAAGQYYGTLTHTPVYLATLAITPVYDGTLDIDPVASGVLDIDPLTSGILDHDATYSGELLVGV